MRAHLAARAVVTAAIVAVAAVAAAHPHATIDQQVQFSLGLDRAEVTVVIMPSPQDGPALFGRVDADDDGAVSEAEAQAFADAVAADLFLSVDGEAMALGPATARVAPADEVRAGIGGLSVTAEALLALSPDDPHVVAFAVSFEDFAHEWFVQPFYHPELTAAFGTPGLERSADGGMVTVELGS